MLKREIRDFLREPPVWLFVVVLEIVAGNLLRDSGCHANSFRKVLLQPEDEDFILYGLTQVKIKKSYCLEVELSTQELGAACF